MSKIRIAFCLDNFSVGGTESNAVRTALRLDPTRFDIRFVHSLDGPLLSVVREAGIATKAIRLKGFLSPSIVGHSFELAAYLRSEQIDIVHAHDVYSNILAAAVAPLAGKRHVIVSRRWGLRQYGRGHSLLNRVAYRRASLVLANSEQIARSLERDEGVNKSKVVVVHNFVDTELFNDLDDSERRTLRERLGVPVDSVLIGMVASLKPVKAPDSLLDAFTRIADSHPAAHLIYVGDGEMRAMLEAEVRSRALESRVTFAGIIPNAGRLQRCFDISALCSVSEGSPNSIAEAMASARPIVATSVGGIPDAIHDGNTGRLVRPGDVEALASALEGLLCSPESRIRLGNAAREYANATFHERSVIPHLQKIYESLASKAG